MGKASTTLDVDRDAREIFNLAAIAAGMNDGEAALDVCRKLGTLEAHYRLALRVGDDAPPEYRERDTVRPGRAPTGESVGGNSLRRMDAKYGGRCAKCARGISVGTPIAYDPASKQAFHEGCAR